MIMLLISGKDPYVLLSCLYCVTFLSYNFLTNFCILNILCSAQNAALIFAYIIAMIYFSRDFCFDFIIHQDV